MHVSGTDMSSREFEIDKGALLRIDAQAGDRLQVWLGDVWITQHGDSKDYVLRTGESLILSGEGATLAMAYKRTLLAWYRSDPRPVRPGLLRRIFA
jgi:hypothetical protein